MKEAINRAITGTEAFVDVGGSAADLAEARAALRCELWNREKNVNTVGLLGGYCAFPSLAVNDVLGRELYSTHLTSKDDNFKVSGQTEQQAYVLPDQRTRLTFKVIRECSGSSRCVTSSTVRSSIGGHSSSDIRMANSGFSA